MRVLIIGGTRLLGKEIVEQFVSAKRFQVFVLSRKAGVFKDRGCILVEAERTEGINKLAGEKFDIVIDFIAYGEKHVKEVLDKIHFTKYFFISSCWMTKLNKKFSLDEFITEIDTAAFQELLPVTQNYLANKMAAENFMKSSMVRGKFQILRLPIFWGEDDHTGRLEFYVSRFLDNDPVLMVNGGENICQVASVKDLAKNIYDFILSETPGESPIVEALPGDGIKVCDLLNIIKSATRSGSETIAISESMVKKELPEYLDMEPLWRERFMAITKNNIYSLLNSKSEPIEVWLKDLSEKIKDQGPVADKSLRQREVALARAVS